MARLTGLVVHFVYWSVFGHFNQVQVDVQNKKLMFLTIQKLLNEVIAQYNVNRHFSSFFMPTLVVALRREVDSVFHLKYPLLFKDPTASAAAQTNMTLLLTKLLDPNVLYSRFSSLESGKDAINIKLKQSYSSKTIKVRDLFYTNSALVSAMLPHNAEGTVRARFSNAQAHTLSTAKLQLMSARRSRLQEDEMPGGQLPRLKESQYCRSQPNLKRALKPLSAQKGTPVQSIEEKALAMANDIQLSNVAFRRLNDNLQKRKLKPLFDVLNID